MGNLVRPFNGKNLPRLLAIKQAIYELGISRTALYELIDEEKLQTVKIGRRRLVPVEAIEALIASLLKSGGECEERLAKDERQ